MLLAYWRKLLHVVARVLHSSLPRRSLRSLRETSTPPLPQLAWANLKAVVPCADIVSFPCSTSASLLRARRRLQRKPAVTAPAGVGHDPRPACRVSGERRGEASRGARRTGRWASGPPRPRRSRPRSAPCPPAAARRRSPTLCPPELTKPAHRSRVIGLRKTRKAVCQ